MTTTHHVVTEADKVIVPANDTEPRGLIFNIQGHSVHDGPGTRTTVFLSGCPLRCKWCCNPEGLFAKQVVLYRETKCQHCYHCVESCPYDAVKVMEDGLLFIGSYWILEFFKMKDFSKYGYGVY